jgi:hypothetical protein
VNSEDYFARIVKLCDSNVQSEDEVLVRCTAEICAAIDRLGGGVSLKGFEATIIHTVVEKLKAK